MMRSIHRAEKMLSDAQKSRFWETGAVVVDVAYSDKAMRPLRKQVERWVEASRDHHGPFGKMRDGRPRFDVEPGHHANSPALRRVASPEEISKVFRNLLFEGPLLESVADLIGPNLRFHHAKINSKQPGSATRVKWHQDFTFDPHSNDDCVTAMLFLDDLNGENGPLRIVPRSHRGPLYSLWHEGQFSGAVDEKIARQCDADAVECVGQMGSLCLMHTRTLHASSPNLTDRARTLFIANLTAADAVSLAINAVPSKYSGNIVRGQDPGRIRSIDFDMETPRVPESASFFDQQTVA